jgi:hypothetical protein
VKVVVEIEGRNAIPVRAIPFLTSWETMSPDEVVDALAGYVPAFQGLVAYRLEGTQQKEIPLAWWENFPNRQLKALTEEIKAKETTHETGYQEWRNRSIPILPAGVFVWQDEYETRHNYFHGPEGTAYLIEDNWLPEKEQLTRVALDFDPFIPESNTQLIVMEGFHQPDAKASPAFESLTENKELKLSLRPQTAQAESPWLVIDPQDPIPVQAWYTPARYFARQLVKDDSTLLLKKLILADMVAKSLAKVGINLRGGKKPFVADTILKAFSNVTLG